MKHLCVVGALQKSGTASQAKQPLLLLTSIHDQHEHARGRIKFPTCCRDPSPSLPHSTSADSVWLWTCWQVPTSDPVKKESKRTPEFWATQGLSKPNGWGNWSLSLCLPINILFSARTSLGWSGAEEIHFLMVICSLSITPPQKLTAISKKWRSDHSQGRADLHFWCIIHMTVKGPDHQMRLASWRALGAQKHWEEDNSQGWILAGSNGSGKESSGLSFQQMDYCLILQIEEMKHRETTGWLIVEMKVKAVGFDFLSSPRKSSLPHPRSHAVNILRAGPTPPICFMSVASNLPQFADPFTLSNRAVHLNLLTTGLLSLAFLHILHVARGSSWVCSLWPSADSCVPLSSYQSLHTTRASSRHFQSGPNSV